MKKVLISKPKGCNVTLHKFMKRATRRGGVQINSRLTLFYVLDYGKNVFYTIWIKDDDEFEKKIINYDEMISLYWLYLG